MTTSRIAEIVSFALLPYKRELGDYLFVSPEPSLIIFEPQWLY